MKRIAGIEAVPVAGLLVLARAGSVCAAPFTNGSFETAALSSVGTAPIATVTGWSASGSGLLLERADPSVTLVNDGVQFVRLGQNDTTNSRLYQDFDTVVGQPYEVSYLYSTQDGTGVDALGATQELLVSVFADGNYVTPLASKTDAVGAFNPFFVGVWFLSTPLQFTATTSTTRLEFTDTAGDPVANIGLDAVEVTLIPEPTSAAALAVLGYMAMHRRRA